MILQPFEKALTGSKFDFQSIISNGDSEHEFKDSSSTLLDHIDKLLQIFARCRAYKFYIRSYINENTPTNVLATILQFDAIVRCSKIGVEFNFGSFTSMRLPIEAIGNWLNRTNADGREHNERFLKLKIYDDVPNLGEMFEYLKKVCLSFLYSFLSNSYYPSQKFFADRPDFLYVYVFWVGILSHMTKFFRSGTGSKPYRGSKILKK